MTDSDEFYDDQDSDSLDPNIRAELRKSKERAREAEDAKHEVIQLKRELAFTKAGIPDTGVGALLRKAYDGDTDPEAIRKVAEEYGIFGSNASDQERIDPVREELERHRHIAGATGTGNSGPSPMQELAAAIQGAGSADEIMAIINSTGGESGLYPTSN